MARACKTIAALIVIIAGISTAVRALPATKLNEFTLDDVLSGTFSATGFNGTWISDNEFLYRTSDGGLSKYNVESGQVTSLVAGNFLSSLRGSSFTLSPDGNYILYRTNTLSVWRHSNFARYSIIDLVNGNAIYPLQPQQANPQLMLRYARWNRVGKGLIYVYENDIYYRNLPDSVEDIRLTTTGQSETIFNGIPDWVYEEEMLGTNNAIWISPSGSRMVFATFNDTEVDTLDYPMYGASGNKENQYPDTISIRYPKPGRKNPTVTLSVVDLVTGTVSPNALAPPSELANEDRYFATVDWPTDGEIFVAWLNRKQTTAYLVFCDVNSFQCEKDQTLVETTGWIDLDGPFTFSGNGSIYLMSLPVAQGDSGNYKHLALRDRTTKSITPLTQGLWELTSILRWDEINQFAYIAGTVAGKPAARQVYRVNTNSAAPDFTCVTCDTVNAVGRNCTYNSAGFSVAMTYWVHTCSGPDVPRTVIKETSTNSEVFLVSDNLGLLERLSGMAVPTTFNLQVAVTGNYSAQVRLLLPPVFDASAKYPLLVYVYGGPRSQQITDRYSINWGTHLASSKNVIYALIDGRGSGYQGDRMLHEIYRRMGTVEIEDQIQVTKFMVENFPFIDGEKTAIWGWSYGGYAAALTLARDSENVFKCGMSVAPVTSWLYYDTIYTERYMSLPTAEDNELAYNNSDINLLAENMRNKRFYLLHGTADDNVHYQQSMMLSKSLESLDILFRQQSYPDENHSIGGLNRHLYHSLTNFLMADCFELEDEVWG